MSAFLSFHPPPLLRISLACVYISQQLYSCTGSYSQYYYYDKHTKLCTLHVCTEYSTVTISRKYMHCVHVCSPLTPQVAQKQTSRYRLHSVYSIYVSYLIWAVFYPPSYSPHNHQLRLSYTLHKPLFVPSPCSG